MNKDEAERYNLEVPAGSLLRIIPDGLLTTTETPEIDTYRDVRFEYTESLGEAYKSLSIETRMTFKEITSIRIDNLGASNE